MDSAALTSGIETSVTVDATDSEAAETRTRAAEFVRTTDRNSDGHCSGFRQLVGAETAQ